MTQPILWSFRRCPYAIRARLAIAASKQRVELHEVLLRAKPEAFLSTSPSATVPCLDTGTQVIDESLDIMLWALAQNDPEGWLDMPDEGHSLIARCDGPFKTALDLYKYAPRHPEQDALAQRTLASEFLQDLDARLHDTSFLFGTSPRLSDMAILPFVRQFAHTDQAWFSEQPWPHLIRWLDAFKTSCRFQAVFQKYPAWQPGDPETLFP